MRLLHLTPELPTWRGGTGGATRQFHLLRRLAELGHEVTVVAPVPHGHGGAREALAGAGIRLVESTRPPSRLAEAARALLRNPGLVAAALTRPVLAWQVGVLQDEWYWACVDAAGADESGLSEWNLYGHWVLSHHETHAVHRQLFWRDVTRHPGPLARAAMGLDFDFVAAHRYLRRSRWSRARGTVARVAAEVSAQLRA